MAYVASHRASGFGIGAFLTKAIDALRAFRARRAVYLSTLAELEALNERDLADLGISRFQITDLAREAAYRK